MSLKPISYMPTDELTYDTEDPIYWRADALSKEITRTFEICHGCRMCFKYCDSFPALFKAVDQDCAGDVRNLSETHIEKVMGSCFQCKLCEVQCPYTPRDKHEFQLDFPRLVHRYKAQRAKAKGRPFRDKVLANPDGAGVAARTSFGLANVLNRNQAHRWFMEKFLGIHREKLLPEFAPQTFEKWAKQQGLMTKDRTETVLFQTCYVQHNEPQIGRDTLSVLKENKVGCACIAGLKCCGMPAWESGDLDSLRANATHNIKLLKPFVAAGAKVLVINPTCAMMMRREYVELLPNEHRKDGLALAKAVRDPGEYLWSIRNEERFNTHFKSSPGDTVSYHAPCHLRAQAVGFKGRDLLRKIKGVKPKTVMECCGHDGTYAMKLEGFEPSQRAGARSFDEMKGHRAEVWATDCPLAALQFAQHAGVRPLHPMTILARAYREDGFSQKIHPQKKSD